MIIVEDSDAKPPLAGPSNNNGHLGPVLAQSPGASYTVSYHTGPLLPPPPPPSYPKYPSYQAALLVSVQHPRSPAKRFWKAFAVALLIYLALLTSVRSVVHMASGIHGSAGPRADDGRILQQITSTNWTTYHARPRWAPSYAESAETSFVLPIDADELYLYSRGAYQHGKVQVRQSADARAGDVQVDVRVAYHDAQALARATVCRLRKGSNRHGVGIYTPTPGWADNRDRLYFEVVLTLPAAPSERSPLRINKLTTDTGNFAHDIGDLWQSVLFDDIELGSSNGAIQVNSMTLTKGSVTSSNGAITGHFNASDSLTLRTSNAQIQVTASLLSTARDATKLDMRTSNGAVVSSVSLMTESGTGGNFVVKARSSNDAIKLQYDDAPLRAHLVSDARTSNSPASVVLHPAFEGTYDVSTSNARPGVVDTHPVDPSGAGRRRVVEQTATSRSAVAGRVYWTGQGRRGESVCSVHSSNARASLEL